MIPNEIKLEIAALIRQELQVLQDKLDTSQQEVEILKSNLCGEIDKLKVELAILKEGGDI